MRVLVVVIVVVACAEVVVGCVILIVVGGVDVFIIIIMYANLYSAITLQKNYKGALHKNCHSIVIVFGYARWRYLAIVNNIYIYICLHIQIYIYIYVYYGGSQNIVVHFFSGTLHFVTHHEHTKLTKFGLDWTICTGCSQQLSFHHM